MTINELIEKLQQYQSEGKGHIQVNMRLEARGDGYYECDNEGGIESFYDYGDFLEINGTDGKYPKTENNG